MHVPQTEVILRHHETELVRVTLPPGEYVIGRSPEVEIPVETPLLSRQHARLTINYDHLLLEDLGSSNGTFVAEQAITEATRLFPNQSIRLGPDIILEVHRERAPSEPGVSLAPVQDAVRRALPEEVLTHKRYAIGQQVARGGMGAILAAQQQALQRPVAMKVMLDSADPGDALRFVEEAQVTGQLAHPNIVPVYELGVDEQDQLFYTMKMVRGVTLKKIIELLAQGLEATVKKYPLPALLTIFQKACDALAFAHSRGVVHRDLKPENIMLGDFGEVLVMDWGLAKILGGARSGASPISASDDQGRAGARPSVILTARTSSGEFGGTMAGTIMGTPAYMSPEQARGEVELLDARSDIYALGAILFELLHLRPTVTGSSPMAVVDKVAQGEIDPLVAAVYDRRTSSPATSARRDGDGHRTTSQRVPDSLVAVCRKALAFDREQRYASVEDLQRDLAAYQGGFATSAEQAGAWKQFALFVRRHKAASLGVAAVLLVGGVLGTQAVLEGKRAEREAVRAQRGELLAKAEAKRAEEALADLKKTAPAMLQLAASEASRQHFDSALEKADAALALDPSLGEARWRRGWIFLGQGKPEDALVLLREAQDKAPNPRFATLLPLVEKLVATPQDARHSVALDSPIFEHLSAVGATGEATPFIQYLASTMSQRAKIVRDRVDQWLGKTPDGKPRGDIGSVAGLLHLQLLSARLGTLDPLRGLPIDKLEVSGCNLESLEPLRGMRLVRLNIDINPNIRDLTPLRGMPLESLNMNGSTVTDLSPLAGMPLKKLDLYRNNAVTNIGPLSGAPCEELNIGFCRVIDFSALKGMPLRSLNVSNTMFSDARVLEGMPLEDLSLNSTQIRDLSPLAVLPLKSLDLGGTPARDYTPLLQIKTLVSLVSNAPTESLLPLRSHPSLQAINRYGDRGFRPIAEFWAEYDAQQAAGKK